jgi:uncharacterized membrane protein
MIVLLVPVIALLVFRGLGAAGVTPWGTWAASTRYALAVTLLFTGVAHFTRIKEDMVRMMPPWAPWPLAMVYFTGLCELAGAIGLIVPSLQRAAGVALVIFFIAILPANIHAAQAHIPLAGRPATPLWIRVPLQVVLIVVTWWASR